MSLLLELKKESLILTVVKPFTLIPRIVIPYHFDPYVVRLGSESKRKYDH